MENTFKCHSRFGLGLAFLLLAGSVFVSTPLVAETRGVQRSEPSETEVSEAEKRKQARAVAQMQRMILRVAYRFKDGGGYEWRDTGTPIDLKHQGEYVLKRSVKGTYCCGYTLAVGLVAAERLGLIDDVPIEKIRRFQKLWYGSLPDDQQYLMSYAMEDLGIGGAVTMDEIRPGDFLQYWRSNKSGHSVVFLDWVIDPDMPKGADPVEHRIGFKYRSSQKSTDGIGDTWELFDGEETTIDGKTRKGKVLREKFFPAQFFVKPE